ncbi:gamma-butyrobetaine dioxygenase-like [Acanthaster planci]|uniref:Gamma-butyrobetaine dioxygenase-like n=1 Tax=Acanthaster planci TaxID=133434 RepID=A0A8B7XR83_ACAPL|nr:gamma-butyrobetaine dioxygenase-like [Acanthaster planci]XP_022082698.1 gamma-butyrobetaine dioxygenase-like [Acanthaster planci]
MEAKRLVTMTRDDTARWYRVGMDSGYEGTYPYVWLRDNCRCSECLHASSFQRLFLMADLDPEVVPLSEELVDEGGVLRITWPDQHRSDFDAAWLNRQRFSGSDDGSTVNSPELEMWGAELNGNIPTFDFQKVLQDDRELYNWLSVLNTKGLALVKGAPTERGAVGQLAGRVAYLKPTANGVQFQVFSKRNTCNLAYSTLGLPLHGDMPYRYYTPGIQMLHCIKKTSDVEGGENHFVDGFHVAEQVRKERPEAFQLLSTRDIDYRAAGTDYVLGFHLQTCLPVIQCDKNGRVKQINYNNPVRAPHMSLPVAQITETYRALKLFHNMMYRPENLVYHQLAPGEIVTFSNIRTLHARSAYTITGDGGRHLEGGYLDWDETLSRLRVLRASLFGDVLL